MERGQQREKKKRFLSAVLYLSQFVSVPFSTMYLLVNCKGTII